MESVYLLRFSRRRRGAWRVEEVWSAVSTRPLRRPPRLRPWLPVGTLAVQRAQRPRPPEDVRGLIRFAATPHLSLGLGDLAQAQSFVPRRGPEGVEFGWLLSDHRAVLRLSAILGTTFGTLKVCTRKRCGRVFLAPTRARRLCDPCARVRTTLSPSRRTILRRVDDRLRKHAGGDQRREEALENLSVMPWDEWRAKWDHRSSRGRKPSQHGR